MFGLSFLQEVQIFPFFGLMFWVGPLDSKPIVLSFAFHLFSSFGTFLYTSCAYGLCLVLIRHLTAYSKIFFLPFPSLLSHPLCYQFLVFRKIYCLSPNGMNTSMYFYVLSHWLHLASSIVVILLKFYFFDCWVHQYVAGNIFFFTQKIVEYNCTTVSGFHITSFLFLFLFYIFGFLFSKFLNYKF